MLCKFRAAVRIWSVVFPLAAPCAALAQGTSSSPPAANSAVDNGQIQEITVTAQRRETSLQDTPIAVTAVTSATISEKGLLDIRDVEKLTPGLAIGGDSELGIIPIVIRGIGTTDPEGTTQDSPVAVYSDGVYISRPFGGIFSLPDADRIEVLRGPQGTLFGRNSSAGAIQVVTKQPDGVFEAASDVSYGSYGDYTVRGYVLVPTSDTTGFKFATAVTGLGGWAYNSAKDETYGGEDSRLIRGSFRYKEGDTDVIVQADHSWGESRSHFVNVVLEPNQPIDQDTTNSPSNETRNSSDVSIKLKQKMSFADLDVIGAYVQSEDLENYDADGSQLDLVSLDGIHQVGKQYSLETRLTSNTAGRLHWMGGTFLFAENDSFDGDVVVGSAVTGGAPLPISELDNNSTTRSASAFGELSYDLTDKLQITLGGRYTYDHKSFIGRNLLDADPIAVNDAQTWPAFTPRGIIQYRFTPSVMTYVSASKGFRSGTWSVTASSPIPAKPETVWNYEAGLKSDFFERRLEIDAAVFLEDYKNKQETILIAPGVTAVRNAASATIRGVELEYQARPVPRLSVSGNFSYLDATYGTYIGAPSDVPPGVSDVYSGNQLPYAPHVTALVDVAYSFALTDGSKLILDGSWQYRSRTFYSRENIDIESSNAFSDFDASLSWQRDEHLTVAGYVTNLTDERHPIQIEDFLNEGFGVPTQYNRPREAGIRLNFKF
jgi:iron complex outermembrane recepter protein